MFVCFNDSINSFVNGMQAINIKLDQRDIRIKNVESPKKSTSWEASSSQRKFSKGPINLNPYSPTFVPSKEYYHGDRTDYQYN